MAYSPHASQRKYEFDGSSTDFAHLSVVLTRRCIVHFLLLYRMARVVNSSVLLYLDCTHCGSWLYVILRGLPNDELEAIIDDTRESIITPVVQL